MGLVKSFKEYVKRIGKGCKTLVVRYFSIVAIVNLYNL